MGSAEAGKRVALVIGNAAYQKVPPLANSGNDAEAMAAMFTAANFDLVVLKHDLSVNEARRVLRDFADSARDADLAAVYYAGHGIEIDGINYLVPVDAVLERDIDAFDEAIPLDRILTVIEPAKQLRLVILDACRDNPFSSMKRATGRGIGRGLAKVEPNPNTLVAYAAKAGSTALDGDTKNSPFATALMKYLPKPGLDLRMALGYARDDVLRATGNKQEPFTYGSLGGDNVALVPTEVSDLRPTMDAVAAVDVSNTRADYQSAERVGTKEAWDLFIATYPNGFYTKLAQAQRNKLVAEAERLAASEKARLVQEEQSRLAAERTKASEKANAAAQALTEEQARVTAELTKKIAEARIVAKSTSADEAKSDPPPPRIDTAMNIPPPRREALPSRTLLADMRTGSRWAIGSTSNCNVPKNAYTLEVNSGSIVWRNGLGSVDVESVVSSSGDEFSTTTRSSSHSYGSSERTGQPWAYARDGDHIRVRPGGKSAFTLFRCS
jgi:uncharacterized caspase-like protein